VWRRGEGRILRPSKTVFLPESPYLPASTLEELLTPSGEEAADSNSGRRIAQLLEPFGLAGLIERAGGSDREMEWEHVLSLREQQLLSIARIVSFAPRVAVLHEIAATLDPEHVVQVFALLAEADAAIVMVAQNSDTTGFDVVLELELDGSWRLSS
jgi:putative ATP-binding cassette transporter